MSIVTYASVVRSLMFVMVCIRPVLAYAMSLVRLFMSILGKQHCSAVKWIIRYVKGFLDMEQIYGKGSKNFNSIVGYVDADFAGDLDRRSSQIGYIFTVLGNAISQKASLQHVVPLSTLNQNIQPCQMLLKRQFRLEIYQRILA